MSWADAWQVPRDPREQMPVRVSGEGRNSQGRAQRLETGRASAWLNRRWQELTPS